MCFASMGAELQSSDGVPDTVLILNDVESLSKIHADHTVAGGSNPCRVAFAACFEWSPSDLH